jgi:hypothetical protein
MPTDAVTAEPPRHPLHALATFELRDYRRRLERAIAYSDAKNPVPPVRGDLQAALDAVVAEQEDRARLAASLALVRPGSPVRGPILAQLRAIDTELAARTGSVPNRATVL